MSDNPSGVQVEARDSLEALDLSIEHWKRLAEGNSFRLESPFAHDCALCHMFAVKEYSCLNCPIAQTTNLPGCEDTPWSAAARAYDQEGKASFSFRNAAKHMHDFLVRVRKERFNV